METLTDLIKELYSQLCSPEMINKLEVTVYFDEGQKISKMINLQIDDVPKLPSFELFDKLNDISHKLMLLPEKYRLKECKFCVRPGGQMDISPVYLQ